MSFADSFWTHDYHLGFKVLFQELHQGIGENEDFILLFTKRMELELIYGTQLESIKDTKPNKRFTNDDYVSSVKNAYLKINENFARQGEYHLQVAENIKVLVLDPFSKWCKEHRQRVEYLESMINDKYKVFKTGKANVEKLQKRYFNKCRMLEEFKSHYTEEELSEELRDLEFAKAHSNEEATEEEELQTYTLGGHTYDAKTLKALLTDIITHIELTSHKVAILGTYNNVSTGSAITQWLLDNMPEFHSNIAKAEAFGQDLINNGFVRLIGSMGNKNFINSSQFYYQWKPVVFELTRLPIDHSTVEDEAQLSRSSSITRPAQFADYFEDVKQAIGVNSIDYSDKTQLLKLINEVNSLDAQYFKATADLDRLRCDFEELAMDHLTFMHKCELDRLKAVKKVTFDFLASFANKVSTMKNMCDELIVLEETINPVNDLKFLIENYSTGKFKPHVILYDNYYNSNIKQTFGVSLNVKSRLDRKVVPIIVQCILSHLDGVYPDLINDEERVNLWTQPIHLANVHQLRAKLNDVHDPQAIHEILSQNHPMIITNLLKLYFMELPDSLVPQSYYDLIKSLYVNYPVSAHDDAVNESRITGLQNVLVDLPKTHLATLDALLTHLNRLVSIIGTKNDELATTFQQKLSKEFGSVLLRAKPDLLSGDGAASDQHHTSFVVDLFESKETIFKELRRRNSSRQDVSASSSLKRSQKPKESAAASSKVRLESRLKKAVTKTKQHVLVVSESDRRGSADGEYAPNNSDGDISLAEPILASATPTIKRTSSTVLPEPPATPPPHSPTKKPGSLKRSTSPNKKKLTTTLYEASNDKPPRSVVSSRPMKKDIVYSNGPSPNGSTGDLTQPKFVGLERRTSVKDLAQRFDSPPPKVPPKEKSGSSEDVIVVE